MRLRKMMYIFVLTVFVLTACGQETEEKKAQIETEQPEEARNNQVDDANDAEDLTDSTTVTDSNTSIGSSNSTTTNPSTENNGSTSDNSNTTTGNTTKPSTGSTTKPSTGSTGNSGSTNNSGNTGGTQNNNTSITTQPVHEHKWVEVTEDEIHYYDWRSICGKCGTDVIDMTTDDRAYHVGIICRGGYSVKLVEVDFVTENIVKTPVVTGYKCECGAEKK